MCDKETNLNTLFHSVRIYTSPDACMLSNPPLLASLWALWAVWLLTADPDQGRDPAPALCPQVGSHTAAQHSLQECGWTLGGTYWPATLPLYVSGGPTVSLFFQPTSLEQNYKQSCRQVVTKLFERLTSTKYNANHCNLHGQWPHVACTVCVVSTFSHRHVESLIHTSKTSRNVTSCKQGAGSRLINPPCWEAQHCEYW